MKRWMNLWVYYLPFPVFAAVLVAWLKLFGSDRLAFHVMILPIIYGYVVPGIATNFLHKWRFTGKWRLGNYYWHHGFLYSRHMALFLLIPFLAVASDSTPKDLKLLQEVSLILSTGFIHGFFYWLHDTVILKLGMVELNTPIAKAGKCPEAVVYAYAPVVFTLLGMSYALSAILAYRAFILEGATSPWDSVEHLAIGIALTFSIPSIAYGILEKRPLL